MIRLWGAMQDTYKFRWKDYATYVTWAVALANFHMQADSLHAEDGQSYLCYFHRIRRIEKNNCSKRREQVNASCRDQRVCHKITLTDNIQHGSWTLFLWLEP